MEIRKSKLDSGLYDLKPFRSDDEPLLSQTMSGYDAIEGGDRESVSLGIDPDGQQSPQAATVERPDRVALKLIVTPGLEGEIADNISGLGAEVTSLGREVIVANIPRDALEELEGIVGLRRAEESRQFHPTMIDARGEATRLDEIQMSNPGLDGTGVVVGVIDTGIDWSHPDFIQNDQSRLELFMHSRRDPISGNDIHVEFNRAQIDQARRQHFAVPKGDPQGHGTHCASIAAGNGSADINYRGIATQAVLAGMRSDGLFDTHIIRGLERISQMAGGRPAVVNLSLGSHWGPHDGTSAMETAIADFSGPGRIVVVSAGNDGEHRIHYSTKISEGQTIDIPFTIRDWHQWINLWVPRGDKVSFQIVDHNGQAVVPTGKVQETDAGKFIADLREDTINLDANLLVAVTSRQLGRRWFIRAHGETIIDGRIHAWGLTQNPNRARDIFTSVSTQSHSISEPGTEDRAVVVGSVVSRSAHLKHGRAERGLTIGGLSPFSSRGPTRNGVQKPDICAPGQFIGAALAADCEMARSPDYARRRFGNDQYVAIQGTSMATPFVTGVIALMLQIEPTLTPEDVKKMLRVTACRDAQTGGVWNRDFGHGKLDAAALITYLMKQRD